jgi:hypothetical protein
MGVRGKSCMDYSPLFEYRTSITSNAEEFCNVVIGRVLHAQAARLRDLR